MRSRSSQTAKVSKGAASDSSTSTAPLEVFEQMVNPESRKTASMARFSERVVAVNRSNPAWLAIMAMRSSSAVATVLSSEMIVDGEGRFRGLRIDPLVGRDAKDPLGPVDGALRQKRDALSGVGGLGLIGDDRVGRLRHRKEAQPSRLGGELVKN
jgi:hypothetical protein